MDTLDCMHTFIRVVETQSFTKAAQEGTISQSLASKQVAWLEARLGAKLLNRSTRRLSLTETGQAYYEQCLKVIAEADLANNIVSELQGRPQGHLRVTCPSGLGVALLNQAFAEFSLTHPGISLETRLTDELVDFTEGRIDFALRLAPTLPDSNLIANEIARIKLNVCASPAYLEQHGTPDTPEDLKGHNCLRYAHARTGSDTWYLRNSAGTHKVDVRGNYRANNPIFMKEAVLKGVGIAILPSYIHTPDVQQGRLTVLFDDFEIEELKLFLIRQYRQYIPLRMKMFQSFIQTWAQSHCHAPARAAS